MSHFDALVIGGGIVGLSAARALQRQYPGWRVAVVEKERELGQHQTGHNSGVLHSGIYYKPGSAKATLCIAGKKEMEAFCRENEIALRICGKVIVATEEEELPRLETLYERGVRNGVDVEMIDTKRLRGIEPHARGIRAIHVKNAGVVNYRTVVERLRACIEAAGGTVFTGRRITSIESRKESVIARGEDFELESSYLVNCAGLHSDRVARLTSDAVPAHIVPFRGEYYAVKPEAADLCRALIYPVPDPRFPFLGVHMTRSVDGEVECGPNAVLAFAREGYRKRDVSAADLAEILGYRGFWKLAARFWRTGAMEMWRSFSRGAFLRAVQRLVPDLRDEHLEPAPAGVRAQAVAPSGELLDDFAIVSSGRVVNVINAPSPAATASLAIGGAIASRLRDLGAAARVAVAAILCTLTMAASASGGGRPARIGRASSPAARASSETLAASGRDARPPIASTEFFHTEYPSVLKDGDTYRMWYSAYGEDARGASAWRIHYATSSDGIAWTKHGVVLDRGPKGTWEESGVAFPAVLRRGGELVMFYGGQTQGVYAIGRARSSDGVHWMRSLENPVVTAEPRRYAWEAGGLLDPAVVYDAKKQRYLMWYNATGSGYAYGLATSADGVHWRKHDGNPVLSGGTGAEWDATVYTATVIEDKGMYKLWYAAGLNGRGASLGLATSKDGVRWTKSRSNPFTLQPVESTDAWNAYGDFYYGAYVLRDGNVLKMWVNGISGANQPYGSIAYATSADGVAWRKGPSNPVICPDGWPGGGRLLVAGCWLSGVCDAPQTTSNKQQATRSLVNE